MTGKSTSPAAPAARDFIAICGGVYEHSPWVAQALLDAGLSAADEDLERLAVRMAAIVENAGHDRQLELLRLHPELVGKLRIGEELTASSKQEQASAGLDQCTPEEFARFQEFNRAYQSRFGFPFIIAVTGLTRAAILEAFERRLSNSYEQEFRTALDEVHKIARLRLGRIALQAEARK